MLLALGLAAVSVATVWPVLIAALFLLSVGQGCASPSITSLVSEHAPPHRRGEAMGFQQSAGAIGRIVGPPMAGWMFDTTGIWSPYVAAAVLCAGAVVLLVVWGFQRPMNAQSA